MNKLAVGIIVGCLLVLFGVPLFFQGESETRNSSLQKVIIVTPHNEQIRYEFGTAFDLWHAEHYGESVQVVWSVPGGTSEIRRMLQSQYQHAIETGAEPGGEADLVFGGGSYEHSVLKRPIEVEVNGELQSTTITVPIALSREYLDSTYGTTLIGDVRLYDSEGYWHGVALSGFGIVYNNDVLNSLNISSPDSWEALCNPALFGSLALVNPAQSGSVTTAFEAILKNLGWIRGWQVLRRAAANARYFSASSLKPPADVSQGDAAMGVCIDFYGRYQSQAIKEMGGGDRVGYIDPPGATIIDPDPISLMRGAPNKKLAERFIKFCLSEEAQSLWQFSVLEGAEWEEETLVPLRGPIKFELRRMPVNKNLYSKYMDRMIDQVNPYAIAKPSPFPDRNMRPFIAPLFSGMAMDHHDDLIDAWHAIITHPSYPNTQKIVTSADVEDENLKALLAAFDAMPLFDGVDSEEDLSTADGRAAIKNGWLKDGLRGRGLWHLEDQGSNALRQISAKFFLNQYQYILELSGE